MSNADLIEQLDALSTEARLLREDLARSEDAPALPTARCLVRLEKLNHDLGKVARAARKALAPLFGREAEGDDQGGDKKPRPKK